LVRRHGAVADDVPVALVVLAEEVGGQGVTAAMSMAPLGIDLHFH
jgi:hypothetical protein